MAVEKILQEALALPREDRARLLEALLRSLDPDEIDEGRAKLIPAEEVFAALRARFPPP